MIRADDHLIRATWIRRSTIFFTVSHLTSKCLQKGGGIGSSDPRAGYLFQRSSVPPRADCVRKPERGGAIRIFGSWDLMTEKDSDGGGTPPLRYHLERAFHTPARRCMPERRQLRRGARRSASRSWWPRRSGGPRPNLCRDGIRHPHPSRTTHCSHHFAAASYANRSWPAATRESRTVRR
jgi:hypothetical protein